MGRTYHFECPHCFYRAKASGGADSGAHCEVQTVVCRDCRELYDVLTRLQQAEDAAGRRTKFPGFFRPEIPPAILHGNPPRRRLVWRKFPPVCPVDAKHMAEAWQDPGRCPRCGNFMEKSGLPFRLWD